MDESIDYGSNTLPTSWVQAKQQVWAFMAQSMNQNTQLTSKLEQTLQALDDITVKQSKMDIAIRQMASDLQKAYAKITHQDTYILGLERSIQSLERKALPLATTATTATQYAGPPSQPKVLRQVSDEFLKIQEGEKRTLVDIKIALEDHAVKTDRVLDVAFVVSKTSGALRRFLDRKLTLDPNLSLPTLWSLMYKKLHPHVDEQEFRSQMKTQSLAKNTATQVGDHYQQIAATWKMSGVLGYPDDATLMEYFLADSQAELLVDDKMATAVDEARKIQKDGSITNLLDLCEILETTVSCCIKMSKKHNSQLATHLKSSKGSPLVKKKRCVHHPGSSSHDTKDCNMPGRSPPGRAPPVKGNVTDSSSEECRICKVKGHFARQCPQRLLNVDDYASFKQWKDERQSQKQVQEGEIDLNYLLSLGMISRFEIDSKTCGGPGGTEEIPWFHEPAFFDDNVGAIDCGMDTQDHQPSPPPYPLPPSPPRAELTLGVTNAYMGLPERFQIGKSRPTGALAVDSKSAINLSSALNIYASGTASMCRSRNRKWQRFLGNRRRDRWWRKVMKARFAQRRISFRNRARSLAHAIGGHSSKELSLRSRIRSKPRYEPSFPICEPASPAPLYEPASPVYEPTSPAPLDMVDDA